MTPSVASPPDAAQGAHPVILLTDLDDSCFQTERKCASTSDLRAAAWDRSGLASSFQSPAQHSMLGLMRAGALVVPVTGRNQDALARTMFRDAPYAITSFGAVIWTPSGPDPSWEQQQPLLDRTTFAVLVEAVRNRIHEDTAPLRCSLVEDAGRSRYVSVKAASEATPDPLDLLVQYLREQGHLDDAWRLYRTDRSLAIAPSHLGKGAAVRHFLAHLAPAHSCTIGLGDGVADAEFLALCSFAMVPHGSVLHGRLLPA